MTSEPNSPLHVWVWLPAATDPVVAGVLTETDSGTVLFTYGRSYLERPDAISLYTPELPLRVGPISPNGGLTIAGCLRDAAPDAWGQRVILANRRGTLSPTSDTGDLSVLTYLAEAGSDRIGAVDVTASPTEYMPRPTAASLAELHQAADLLDSGEQLSPGLAEALTRGTSIGGARPKALLNEVQADGTFRPLIAKFSSTSDVFPVVKAEALGFELARRSDINTPDSWLQRSLGKDVLVVERFDRTSSGGRKMLVSALTMFGLDEMFGRYATYVGLADHIRGSFTEPEATLTELFRRIVFNMLIGNTDDHARNHAGFWDGNALTLTPAFDLCPQLRSGTEAFQAMSYGVNGERSARLAPLIANAHVYQLDAKAATEHVEQLRTAVHDHWADAAEAAQLTQGDRAYLWGRQILNPYLDQ